MASHLIIVHGYSDGYLKKDGSFKKLRAFLVKNKRYSSNKVHFVEYSSMDDRATYEDFADKLNSDFEKKIPKGTRVDILCHSTGALVTRIWLASRRRRQRERGQALDIPVDRIFMFAPANFGSDLARMGQSFLGKTKSTFFNRNIKKGNRWESGKVVLQGLEPASPFQWDLSMVDLHEETYFGPHDPTGQMCKPFVFAAGEGYPGQSKIIRKRNKPGTDGTVRICGTDMNTRKCTLFFSEAGPVLSWKKEVKCSAIPFAVFQGVNHGSILSPDHNGFDGPDGPGTLLLKATRVTSEAQYTASFKVFNQASENNYAVAKGENADRYQQFFFKVRDDAGFNVEDFFVDFSVVVPADRSTSRTLSRQFDEAFEERVTVHSQDRSHRAFLINLKNLHQTLRDIKKQKGKVILKITAKKPYDEVSYDDGDFVVYDASGTAGKQPDFIFENTTTLIEVVMNRRQSDEILRLRKTLS
ncbi:MAG: hypothetical protein V3V05_01040 [Pontiella sp.]